MVIEREQWDHLTRNTLQVAFASSYKMANRIVVAAHLLDQSQVRSWEGILAHLDQAPVALDRPGDDRLTLVLQDLDVEIDDLLVDPDPVVKLEDQPATIEAFRAVTRLRQVVRVEPVGRLRLERERRLVLELHRQLFARHHLLEDVARDRPRLRQLACEVDDLALHLGRQELVGPIAWRD